MKSIILITLLFFSGVFFCNAQNWEATNLTISNAFAITDIHSHDGTLFATVNMGISGALEASTNDGQSWSTQTMTNVVGFPQFMASAGNRLYMSSNNTFHGILYYSEDGGATFTQDIAGLPAGIGGGAVIITSVQTLGNMLVIGLGSDGYYAKDINNLANSFIKFDTVTSLNAGTDPVAFHNGVLYTYDNAGAKTFYSSIDFGTNWTVPSSNGLPTDLQSEILEINQVTGRIYLSGESNFSGNIAANYGLYYSDDGGNNWSQMDLSMVAATNHLSDFHKVMALYSQGNLFYAAFDNDVANSAPDVISSTNFPTITPVIDDVGLPTDVPGNVHGRKFIEHNGKMALSLNLIDVYIKGEALSNNKTLAESFFKLYPTIIKNQPLLIDTKYDGELKIFDCTGRKILKTFVHEGDNQINVSYLSTGMYYLTLDFEGAKYIKRIIVR